MKAELKTKKTSASVKDFLDGIADEERRQDCRTVAKMLQRATGAKPTMWGPSVVGFGDYHYRYESGRENDWFVAGFSPRKGDLTIYLMSGLPQYEHILKRLGKHRTGKGCLYIRRLSDVDETVLEELVTTSAHDLVSGRRRP